MMQCYLDTLNIIHPNYVIIGRWIKVTVGYSDPEVICEESQMLLQAQPLRHATSKGNT